MAVCAATLLFGLEARAQAELLPTRHVRQEVVNGQAQFLSAMPPAQSMRLDLVLPLRNQAGLDQLLKDLYDSSNPSYRHFLSVSEFTAQFGPSAETYNEVARFASAKGFQVVGGSRDGMDLQIEGPVRAVEAAFGVRMGIYQHPTENRTFYAPDREPVAAGLATPLWHISGLDNFSIPKPRLVRKSDYALARGLNPDTVVSHATTGSGPAASFLGSDMRAAYYGGSALTGAGQNLGLLEYAGTDLADLNNYFKNTGQTNNVPLTLISTDGTSVNCVDNTGGGFCDDTEQTLDMTQAIGMAPGLANLYFFVGSSDTAILSAMTTHIPLPMTIGCSWGWTPSDPGTLDPFFQKMAAQGQSFFVASGDNSTWTASGKSAAWPADDANVISVGGTDLITASAAGPWKSETAWGDSGGGISPDGVAIPVWQQTGGVINANNKGSNVLRNGPDVSANANFTFYTCANQGGCLANQYGGTSFAAPMWAGYAALANQQAAINGEPPVGFLNPAIYAIGLGVSYSADLHDITSGISGSYSAVTGYDLVTGWGSPNGANLISGLLGATAPNFTISAAPGAVSVAQSGSGTSTVTTTVSGGFNAPISLSASGQPAGVTVTFSPAAIAAPGGGTSTVTMAVAANAAVGSYTITVTGTGGNIVQTATVTLNVTAPPVFAISAAPVTVSVAQGGSGTSTVTTTVSGGFNAPISLSASGQPAGVTVTFNPAAIGAPGAGTSTMTMAVAANAAVGSYKITVTGTGGNIVQTTTVTLNVTVPPAFTISAAPVTVSVAQGGSGTSTVTTTVSGGFNAAISMSASGQPAGVTVAFSPAAIGAPGAGTSTITMAVAANAAVGSYPITITGTGGNIAQTATVTLNVTAAVTPAFTLSAGGLAATAAPGGQWDTRLTTTISGGFNSAISLSTSGLPAGVTTTLTVPTIAAPGAGNSGLKIFVAANTAPGTYQITVTGTSGNVSHTVTIALTVT
jgi:kumamolisin